MAAASKIRRIRRSGLAWDRKRPVSPSGCAFILSESSRGQTGRTAFAVRRSQFAYALCGTVHCEKRAANSQRRAFQFAIYCQRAQLGPRTSLVLPDGCARRPGIAAVFFVDFPAVTDDSHVYADSPPTGCSTHLWPDAGAAHRAHRHALPGYPAFLAIIFWLFGAGNFKAVMLAQIVFDLATCLIVADIARRMLSTRAAKIAFLLASLCPFLANYSAAVLTETLEIFFTVLALDCAVAALNRMHAGEAGSTNLGCHRRRHCRLHSAAPGWRHPADRRRILCGAAARKTTIRVPLSLASSSPPLPWPARALDLRKLPRPPSLSAPGSALRKRAGGTHSVGFNRWSKPGWRSMCPSKRSTGACKAIGSTPKNCPRARGRTAFHRYDAGGHRRL